MSFPSTKIIKRLFALSGNICAFPNCSVTLVDDESGSVIGEICHIKGRNSDSARYDPAQTDEQRNAFENLILMCPKHHKIIDDNAKIYTVVLLQQIKDNLEVRYSSLINDEWLHIDDVLIGQGTKNIKLDVRVRNSGKGIVNLTRADLHIPP